MTSYHSAVTWAHLRQPRRVVERGVDDARGERALLERLALLPERVILSDSRRTTETFEGMWSVMPNVTPTYAPSLYLGNLGNIQDECARVDDSIGRVLVIGHNPGFSLAATQLSGQPVELKTAYIAVLENESTAWDSLDDLGTWTLKHLLTPAHGHGQLPI